MSIRLYDAQKDKEAVRRIWREVGWLEKEKEECMDLMLEPSRGWVADIEGEPECFVMTTPATMRYIDQDLPLSACTGVTTSRIARRQGLARRLAAQSIAADAVDGALVAGLSMFEQGYYNQLGYGTGSYEHWIAFDPARLSVKKKPRVPRRLKLEQFEAIHAARAARRRGHGAGTLPVQCTKADMIWADNGFGLGYFDGPQGELTHCFWGGAKEIESGPYEVTFLAYQTAEQFLELMAVIRSLGDQVHLVRMREPQDIQLQDLIVQPFKHRRITQKSPFEAVNRASAYFQARICDLPGCLAHTHLRGGPLRFNLALSDPIAAYLDESAPWRGVGGEYVVTLGASSGAERGTDPALPTLTASVGAFTRLWLGVRPASGLAVTDDLAGPPALLDELDWLLRLPDLHPDWEF